MKKETFIRLIDDEFADSHEFSWLIEVIERAILKNDSRITECTREYEERFNWTINTLHQLGIKLKDMEKEELKNGVRITHKRKNGKEKVNVED